jgi:hypothetical protein
VLPAGGGRRRSTDEPQVERRLTGTYDNLMVLATAGPERYDDLVGLLRRETIIDG